VLSSPSYRAGRFNLFPGRSEYDIFGADDIQDSVLLWILPRSGLSKLVYGSGYLGRREFDT
jgi:hypothetical protein